MWHGIVRYNMKGGEWRGGMREGIGIATCGGGVWGGAEGIKPDESTKASKQGRIEQKTKDSEAM